VNLVIRQSLDPGRRFANFDEPTAVELCCSSLIFLCHVPEFSSRSIARCGIRLVCANQRKLFKIFMRPRIPSITYALRRSFHVFSVKCIA
jgi:hypothetical protein